MGIQKDIAIKNIESQFETMSNIVLEQLDYIEQIITSGQMQVDKSIMLKIEQNEKTINNIENQLNEKITTVLTLQQLMASDLRKIISCYRIIISLERIGDLSLNIAQHISKIKTPQLYETFHNVFINTVVHGCQMVKISLLSFTESNTEFAIWTIKNDDILDDINNKLLKNIVKKANSHEETSKKLFHSLIIIREMMANLERIGDYATNIAEDAIYSIEGRDIKHSKIYTNEQ